jgi:hypothetical protein
MTGLLPAHDPAWQVSVCVQALSSLQPVPFAFGVGSEQMPVPELHVPGSLH